MHLAKINGRLLVFALQSCMESVSSYFDAKALSNIMLQFLVKMDIH